MLKLIDNIPFDPTAWPGNWVWTQDSGSSFEVVQFCSYFSANEALPLRLHISADNRYKLYLDGNFMGMGPQRGTLDRYFFDTYDLSLTQIKPGQHIFSAIVWYDRDTAPSAQITSRPAFLAVAEYADGKIKGTLEKWKYKRWFGNATIPVPEDAYCIGVGYEMIGFTLADLCPTMEIFQKEFMPVKALGYSRNHKENHPQLLLNWNLHQRTIPALKSENCHLGSCKRIFYNGTLTSTLQDEISLLAQNSLCENAKAVTIPANSKYKILIDNEKLVVGYPTLTVTGGKDASISLTYQEALQSNEDVRSKGNRNEIGNRILIGITDHFLLADREHVVLEPFCYRCWRYIELDIETSDQALIIENLSYRSTGYPLELKAEFETNDWFNRLIEPGFRTMQLCAGETYMDCPYYEQLQYIGDTRIQALLSYVLCNDDRLAREAIEMFGLSLGWDGLTFSSYPNRFKQTIPLFSLLYIAMLNDFLMWRGDITFVKQKLGIVETILNTFKRYKKENGLLGKLPGWPFIDWAKYPSWKDGHPTSASQGNCYLVSFFYLYAIQQAINLFKFAGNQENTDRLIQEMQGIREILQKQAFDPQRKVFVDDPGGLALSQHTNILAILTDSFKEVVDGQVLLNNILNNQDIAKATVYFKFYLYEAMYHVGRAELIWSDFKLWHDMLDNGLTTFAEKPEPTRSDCHAWSSHPLYHFIASIIGVRPMTPGCSTLSIKRLLKTKTDPPMPQILGAKFNTVAGKCCVRLTIDENRCDIYKEFPSEVAIFDS
ncbi:MAG: hypothetical protein A2Y12_19620 [Planctomycetes bacterium GWF2_42_9]|nr:MAG: hypothetical protein A2Y12_19620 [Planctomycetes bacterium GWF2_42_9]